jgi:hypothetical protein
MYQIAYHQLYCLAKDEYYKEGCPSGTAASVRSALAILLFLGGTMMLLLLGNLMIEPNPFERTPISKPFRNEVVKSVVLKMLFPMFYQFGGDKGKVLCIWVGFVLLVINEIYGVVNPVSYKVEMVRFFRVLDSLQFWFVLCACVNYVSCGLRVGV